MHLTRVPDPAARCLPSSWLLRTQFSPLGPFPRHVCSIYPLSTVSGPPTHLPKGSKTHPPRQKCTSPSCRTGILAGGVWRRKLEIRAHWRCNIYGSVRSCGLSVCLVSRLLWQRCVPQGRPIVNPYTLCLACPKHLDSESYNGKLDLCIGSSSSPTHTVIQCLMF